MSKFDEARKLVNAQEVIGIFDIEWRTRNSLNDFITLCEETEHQLRQEKKAYLGCSTRYNELVKDVKRLTKLNNIIRNTYWACDEDVKPYLNERKEIEDNLSKLGVENE